MSKPSLKTRTLRIISAYDNHGPDAITDQGIRVLVYVAKNVPNASRVYGIPAIMETLPRARVDAAVDAVYAAPLTR